MRLRPYLAPLAALLLALTACGDLVEPAAAVVNEDKITVDEVAAALEEFRGTDRYKQLAETGDVELVERQFEQGFLSTLVRRAVLEPEAEELGIEVTDADVQEQLDTIKQDFPDEEAFQQALAEQALTEEQLTDLVRDRQIEEALRERVTADASATDEEIRAYYNEHLEDYEQMKAQHVLVEERDLAQTIATQLQIAPKKKVDKLFERLAARHSTDQQSARRGGDLGYTSPGELVPEFEEAAAALEVGQVSDPVQTEFGWHVIRVTDRRTRSFEQVRDEIAEQLSGPAEDEAFSTWIEAAYEEADVRVNPRYGELDEVTGQIGDATAEDVPGAEPGQLPEGEGQQPPIPEGQQP